MTPASAFQQSLSDVKSALVFRRSGSTHHGSRSSFGDRSRSFTTLEPLSKPAIAHHGGDPVFQESATASRRRSSREDLSPHLCMASALALSGDPGRHAQGPRRRDHLSAIRIVPPRHHSDDLRLLGDVVRVMPHGARVRAHLSTPTIRARRALSLSPEGESRSGACVHLHSWMQISARNRRRRASFDALVSFPPPSFDEGFHCRRLSPPPRHPRPPCPFGQDLRRHSCPPVFASALRRPLDSEDLGARTASHLSTLAIHRHFRAHARARFHVYLPIKPRISGPSFDSSRAVGSLSVHTSTHVFTSRLSARTNTLTARVHFQRIVIEKVLASLSPRSPSCSSF